MPKIEKYLRLSSENHTRIRYLKNADKNDDKIVIIESQESSTDAGFTATTATVSHVEPH